WAHQEAGRIGREGGEQRRRGIAGREEHRGEERRERRIEVEIVPFEHGAERGGEDDELLVARHSGAARGRVRERGHGHHPPSTDLVRATKRQLDRNLDIRPALAAATLTPVATRSLCYFGRIAGCPMGAVAAGFRTAAKRTCVAVRAAEQCLLFAGSLDRWIRRRPIAWSLRTIIRCFVEPCARRSRACSPMPRSPRRARSTRPSSSST